MEDIEVAAIEAESDDGKDKHTSMAFHPSVQVQLAHVRGVAVHAANSKSASTSHLAAVPCMHADLRTLENRPRRDGKRALPSRLTAHQQQVIQRLVQAHGQDLEVCIVPASTLVTLSLAVCLSVFSQLQLHLMAAEESHPDLPEHTRVQQAHR